MSEILIAARKSLTDPRWGCASWPLIAVAATIGGEPWFAMGAMFFAGVAVSRFVWGRIDV